MQHLLALENVNVRMLKIVCSDAQNNYSHILAKIDQKECA